MSSLPNKSTSTSTPKRHFRPMASVHCMQIRYPALRINISFDEEFDVITQKVQRGESLVSDVMPWSYSKQLPVRRFKRSDSVETATSSSDESLSSNSNISLSSASSIDSDCSDDEDIEDFIEDTCFTANDDLAATILGSYPSICIVIINLISAYQFTSFLANLTRVQFWVVMGDIRSFFAGTIDWLVYLERMSSLRDQDESDVAREKKLFGPTGKPSPGFLPCVLVMVFQYTVLKWGCIGVAASFMYFKVFRWIGLPFWLACPLGLILGGGGAAGAVEQRYAGYTKKPEGTRTTTA